MKKKKRKKAPIHFVSIYCFSELSKRFTSSASQSTAPLHCVSKRAMDDDGGDDDLQQTRGFTSEDFLELNDITNLTTTSSIEEISELYKSFNSTNDYGTSCWSHGIWWRLGCREDGSLWSMDIVTGHGQGLLSKEKLKEGLQLVPLVIFHLNFTVRYAKTL